jgi:hypothetical protein
MNNCVERVYNSYETEQKAQTKRNTLKNQKMITKMRIVVFGIR